MFAVIETGGKQYLVQPHTKISVDRLPQEEGEVAFDKVLLVANADGTDLEIGAPYLAKKIIGAISKQYRDRKIMVRKFKNKVRYRRTAGHRQYKTDVSIGAIK